MRSMNDAASPPAAQASGAPPPASRGGTPAFDDDPRALAALRLQWLAIALLVSFDLVGLAVARIGVRPLGFAIHAAGIAAMTAPLALPRYRRDARAFVALAQIGTLASFMMAAVIASYLAVLPGAPLIDVQLAAADRALGLDWRACFDAVAARPWLAALLGAAYMSLIPQALGALAWLGMRRMTARAVALTSQLMFSSTVTSLIAAAWPARSAWFYYGVAAPVGAGSVADFDLLRQHALKLFDFDHAQGLVSMPSFHTAMALLIAYALRGTPAFVPFALLDAAVIASTPFCGGHYFADVIGGVLLAVVTVAVSHAATPLLLRWSARRSGAADEA